ncbi:glycosyltransferase family 2 protein [Rosenbergiella nectarea]|uniref:glycosyltransferase family 2 protein n=1 Tax=Rosenbergiella nectarea TaxID=988801 RepID=UPI001F4E1363|nr:glycosyltransferase family 2 protein [Rosenbergiella nectarea]
MIKKLLSYARNSLGLIKFLLLSEYHGKHLKKTFDNTLKIKENDILLFCTIRNEAIRLPFFFEYYEKLGVNHFFIVDNDSTDNLPEIIEEKENVTLFSTSKSYKKSNFGMHWLNYILRRYGAKHWCLTCDPDEFLVLPDRGEENKLADLTFYLDSVARPSFFALMIDMYSDKKLEDNIYELGQNPLEVCSFFDKEGYFFNENYALNSLWAQGGVRMRTLFKNDPYAAPALNKTPLVKWKWYYSYISSMHLLLPRRLNAAYKYSLTGALLHFKFISLFNEKVNEELTRKQHYGDSNEYKKYNSILNNIIFDKNISIKYNSISDLEDIGLTTNREWC